MTGDPFGGYLHIIGGDFNIPEVKDTGDFSKGTKAWWNTATSGYRDVINDRCASTAHKLACDEKTNWTSKAHHHRIDFLFTQLAGGTKPAIRAAHTVTWRQARKAGGTTDQSLTYSDHRAVTALVSY